MSVVLSVENRAGGVGKTTTATVLGLGLAQKLAGQGGRVLIIDLDPQGDSAATMLGLKPGARCVSRLLDGETAFKTAVRQNVMPAGRSESGGPARPGLYVLPGSDRLVGVKAELQKQVAQEIERRVNRGDRNYDDFPDLTRLFNGRLAPLKRLFDVIILDCPPTLDAFQAAIHTLADAAIVPTTLEYKSARATFNHARGIIEDQKNGIDCRVAYLVPTMVDRRLNLTQAMQERLQEYGYSEKMCPPVPRSVRVSEAPAKGGLTIMEYDPKHPASLAYQAMIDMVYDDFVAKEPAYA